MILIDTHVVLWLALEPEALFPGAVSGLLAARRSGGGVGIAAITLWEIAQLTRKGMVELETTLPSFLNSVESAYRVLPITKEIVVRSIAFGRAYPHDPADRMIGATAIVNGLKLVTRDGPIRESGEVDCVW